MLPDEGSVHEERSTEDAHVLGMERRKSEMKTIGGLLLILGSGAAHSSLAISAVVIEGMGGRDQVKGFSLPVLIGSMLQCISGMSSMVVGLNTMLAASLSKTAHKMTLWLLIIANLAPLTIIFSIIRIIMGVQQDASAGVFIPSYMEPTRNDNKLVALCGIVGLISVCQTLLGGLTLLASTLRAFIGDQCTSRNRFSYRLRYGYHACLVALGGLSQFLLGSLCWARFGDGPYDDAVHVTVYTIFLPQLTCIVGFVQMAVGIFGFLRACDWSRIGGAEDRRLELGSLVSWLMTMLLQIIVQPSYAGGDAYDAEGATFASVYLGFFLVPVWLDYRVRVTPTIVSHDYYAIPSDTEQKPDRVAKIVLVLARYFRKDDVEEKKTDLGRTASDESSDSERIVS